MTLAPARPEIPAPLLTHWSAWTGATPQQLAVLGADVALGAAPTVVVVGDVGRTQPSWDGSVAQVTGVVDPAGNAVLSVPPGHDEWARSRLAASRSLTDVRAALPSRLDAPHAVVYQGICRWAVDVPGVHVLPDVGEWLPTADPAVPEWLMPFNGEVLVVLDDAGDYLAGVGLKVHDSHGVEISVGTSEAARGRGLARRLVAQAARTLLSRGIVPTYLHAPDNVGSAKVADAAGFPDRGWTALGLFEPPR